MERHRRGLLAFSISPIFVVAIVFISSSFLVFLFVIRAFAIGHADALEASFDSPLRDEIIFLWLTVERVDSQIDDNYRKQQKLIHKIPLSVTRKGCRDLTAPTAPSHVLGSVRHAVYPPA
jgi:hypothetical protein